MKKMMVVALLAVAACAPTQKDYDAQRRCESLGHKPGNKAYDSCVSEESAAKRMEDQRREYEQMKQQQEDWKMRRNSYGY